MSLERFLLLDHFLQINCTEANAGSMEKLLPLLKLFSEFPSIYTSSSRICIDEIIAPFAGQFKQITYNPQKPEKWGIRIIGVADSTNGYCLTLLPQLGQDIYRYLALKIWMTLLFIR